MIVLDENLTQEDAGALRRLGVRCRHIGTDLGHRGMDDLNDIIPLLRHLQGPTFFTGDADFWKRSLCHAAYCLVVLDVPADAAATYVRRFLRHPEFRTAAQRMGCVARVGPAGITFWRRNDPDELTAAWA